MKAAPRARPKTPRTKGAVALLRSGKTQDELADLLESSRPSVTAWIACRWKPAPEMRQKMLERLGIPVAWWDERFKPSGTADDAPPAKGEDAPAPAVIPTGLLPQLHVLESTVTRLLGELNDPKSKSVPSERARVAHQVGRTLESIARIRASYDLGKQMMSHPTYKRLRQAFADGLKGYPDAAAAVERELRRVEAELGEESK